MDTQNKKLIIGTRGSRLALLQTQIVAEALRNVARVEVVVKSDILTKGDANLGKIPQSEMGKGWFTKEIEDQLLAGEIDAAVHSLKDLPGAVPDGLILAAFLDRTDARDVLVGKIGPRAKIGTGSLRRQVQIKALFDNVEVINLRGNVPTRIAKVESGEYDGAILAAEGLKRLGLEEKISRYFSVGEITPAPGQGILAIEARRNDRDVLNILQKINSQAAQAQALAEREFSNRMDGSCKSAVGAFARVVKNKIVLLGMYGGKSGKKVIRESLEGNVAEAGQLGQRLAEIIKKKW